MPLALTHTGPRQLTYAQEPDAPIRGDAIRVRTLYSGISAGTDLTEFRSTNPLINREFDTSLRVFNDKATDAPQAKVGGYEQVGVVTEVGNFITEFAVGDYIYGDWGHRDGAVVAPGAAHHVIPDGIDPILGIFAKIGAIALNGVLDARINVGETVAVYGLGVVGQLITQLATLSGAQVFAIDLLESRRELTRRLNPSVTVLDPNSKPASTVIKDSTGGLGADVCIEASGAVPALHDAIRACAYNSKVVALGFYVTPAVDLQLAEEFHHNRIQIVCSQISGVNAEIQHRWNRARLTRTFMELVRRGDVTVADLITHRRPFADAQELFDFVDKNPNDFMQAVLTFDENEARQ